MSLQTIAVQPSAFFFVSDVGVTDNGVSHYIVIKKNVINNIDHNKKNAEKQDT